MPAGPRVVCGNGRGQRGEDAVIANKPADAVPVKIVEDLALDANERKNDADVSAVLTNLVECVQPSDVDPVLPSMFSRNQRGRGWAESMAVRHSSAKSAAFAKNSGESYRKTTSPAICCDFE